MQSRFLRFLAAVPLCAMVSAAGAEPLLAALKLRDGGGVARRVWQPDEAATTVSGMRLSAGLAMGLRGPVSATLGTRVAPAVSLEVARDASLWLLPRADGAGTMVVFQMRH
jgi:hypothetical protein